KPLKIGIHQDLVERGMLRPEECRAVFRCYVMRRQYQEAIAAGGPRYDLNGDPVGEVTADQVDAAKAMPARYKAKREARSAEEGGQAFAALRNRRLQNEVKAAAPSSPPAPRRLGLADLKRAAQERKSREACP